MKLLPSILAPVLALTASTALHAEEFRHIGDFLLKSRTKITTDKSTPVPVKPMLLRVYTDGVTVKITAENNEEATTSFEIYRSDGIGRQSGPGGALEVIPGVQAFSKAGGVFRHLRLTRESLTITAFPGVSDQTVVSHAVAVEPTTEKAESKSSTRTTESTTR